MLGVFGAAGHALVVEGVEVQRVGAGGTAVGAGAAARPARAVARLAQLGGRVVVLGVEALDAEAAVQHVVGGARRAL